VPVEGCTPEGGLLLQYMPHGNLSDYLRTHSETISTSQRLQWGFEAVECLQLLHSKGVIHCDVKPKNFLLDAGLELRIADFSSSSLNGSRVPTCRSTRFSLPQGAREQATARSDIFGLGSTIYEIMTGESPYEELGSDEVVRLYKAKDFPAFTESLFDKFIRQCWHGEIASAQEAHDYVKALAII
jgi:serine/threonine protein kinase